jgi:WD40 repeat protein
MWRLLVTAFVILAIGDSIRGDTPVSENPNPIGDLYGDPLPKGALTRLGTVRFRADSLLAMAWSPDSKMLASGGIMTEIRLWDVTTGKEAGRFAESTSASALAWSPNAKMVASAWEDENSTIHLWDVATGKEIRQLDGKHRDGVKSLAWSPDGKTLTSGGCDRTIHLWDPETGKEVRSLSGHEGSVESLALSPDGKLLASGGLDKAIRLWDPMTGKQVRRLPGQVARAERLAWSSDGKLLLSGTVNKTVRLLEVATNKESWLAGVSSPGWSRDGKMLALENGDGTVDICEPGTGKELRRLAGKDLSLVSWSPDGKMLASANGYAIHVWDPITGKEIQPREGHEDVIFSVCWSPDGKVVASGGCDGTIRLWDPATGRSVRSLHGHVSPVSSVCWSPDGKMLASASKIAPYHGALVEERTVRLWDPTTGMEVRRVAGHNRDVWSLAWSPNGKMLASGSEDETIRLWDVATGEEIRQIDCDTREVGELAWSPDGKMLALVSGRHPGSHGDNTIRLFEATSGKQLHPLSHGEPVSSVAWSPDGKTLASATWSKVRFWEVATGREVERFTHGNLHVESLTWSPNGKLLASVLNDMMTVGLWEAATGRKVQRFAGHDGAVWSVAWSPDGKRLATASCDTTVLIWAVENRLKQMPVRLGLEELESCWTSLAENDATKAFQASNALTRSPRDSVPFLARRLSPVFAPDPERVSRLTKDLDDNRFSIRKEATEELEQLGELTVPALRRALADKHSLETKRRIERLLGKLDNWSGEHLRILRAITVLEDITTVEARQILESLTKGAPEARLTQEAKASLGRLDKSFQYEKKGRKAP